jgi:hypothetical protein
VFAGDLPARLDPGQNRVTMMNVSVADARLLPSAFCFRFDLTREWLDLFQMRATVDAPKSPRLGRTEFNRQQGTTRQQRAYLSLEGKSPFGELLQQLEKGQRIHAGDRCSVRKLYILFALRRRHLVRDNDAVSFGGC